MAICLKHTDREATTRCATCFKPLCDECAQSIHGQVFCSDKCAQNYAASEERLAEVAARDRAIARRERKRRLIILLVIVLTAIAALVFLKKNPSAAAKLRDGAKALASRAVNSARGLGDRLKKQAPAR